MLLRAENLKKITDVFEQLSCPLQISPSWEQATVVLTSNSTEQSLESVTDHKFIVKQTFRT